MADLKLDAPERVVPFLNLSELSDMLIEIQGEHTGSITMFGNVAVTLLKMMGQSGKQEGALREEDVPEALNSLRKALQSAPDQSSDDKNSDGDDDSVGIKTRAAPLIKMLEESVDKGGYVMWKPQ